MVEVNEKLTRQVADLARLKLSDQEAKVFTPQLAEVLRYVEQLQKVSVDGVEPLIHPFDTATPLRLDEVKRFELDSEGCPKILQSAPEVLDSGFKVPPIL